MSHIQSLQPETQLKIFSKALHGAGEMSQSVKSLPHNLEDSSSIPSIHVKAENSKAQLHSQHWGDRNIPRAHWKAGPAYPGCARTSERPCLRKQGKHCPRDNTQDWPLASVSTWQNHEQFCPRRWDRTWRYQVRIRKSSLSVTETHYTDLQHEKGHSKSENLGGHISGGIVEPIVWG